MNKRDLYLYTTYLPQHAETFIEYPSNGGEIPHTRRGGILLYFTLGFRPISALFLQKETQNYYKIFLL